MLVKLCDIRSESTNVAWRKYINILIDRLLVERLHFEPRYASFGRGVLQRANAPDALLHSLHYRRASLLLGAFHVGHHLRQNIFRYTIVTLFFF